MISRSSSEKNGLVIADCGAINPCLPSLVVPLIEKQHILEWIRIFPPVCMKITPISA
ncbi:hypothetical protein H206_05144 [Candidatus Electrothrix aarhusensis]|uniref:Uncharacterized protein n=1 Tax=Candidatus Electrothrix aarhusensis TaxID=1859131 RepID=A0A444J5E0_9BACT|nr:hypothetical protein H206_05144 [Candidatus Electrothrix aarhusensis]